ncbi:hypothetical protein OJ998_17210 [Solirubrobacter taibaiensis]|nr:hypothetical protein [Solirubrobacter taibaiensis]
MLALALAALTVGIGDQQPAAFADPRMRSLGLKAARMIVPYDAATSEPDKVAAWLAATRAAGLEPHIAFQHLSSDRCPSAPCTLPSRATYRANVAAFIARFPQVRTYSTWNEANHVSQPTATRPEAVAGYYQELKAACASCTVVAGDVLDSGSYVNWLRRFQAVTSADLWGLHNYADVTYGTTSGTDAVLANTTGTLWVEETGGIVVRRDAAARVLLAHDEARAARAVTAAFTLASTRPRITRLYVYQWQTSATAQFDAGLIRPDGSARPSYAALAAAMPKTGATASPGVTWKASWSKGRLILRGTCSLKPCAGTVKASLRAGGKTIRRYGARQYGTTVKIRVSKTVLTKLRRASVRRVSLTVRSSTPVKASQTVVLKLPQPTLRDLRA